MRLSSLLLLSLLACGGGPTGPIPLEQQKFAASLGVDLAASSKTDTGVYYRDLVQGTGAAAIGCERLNVDYTGWLADGTQFGTSVGVVPGGFNFQLGDGTVIQGWEDGLPGVKAGGTRQLVIPSDLAYGHLKRGNIPPDSNLVFSIVVHSATGAVPIEQTTFAASLNVNLSASVKTAHGVYLRDTAAGTGAVAATGQTLKVDYTGWLADGTRFDASQDHGSSFSFMLGKGQVIPGWDEGLAGVAVGATRQLVIPSSLAYGCYGPGIVPANATLVFSVVVHSAQ